MIKKAVQFMDISKLSRHTKKAKKLIAQALFSSCPNAALSKFKPQKKKININISSLGEIKNTIDRILSNGGTNVPLKIEVDKVVEYICGKDGAAKILADSMLTKSKKEDSPVEIRYFEKSLNSTELSLFLYTREPEYDSDNCGSRNKYDRMEPFGFFAFCGKVVENCHHDQTRKTEQIHEATADSICVLIEQNQ